MPDWFYRTVTRPLLFQLPVPAARTIALGFLGNLARFRLGKAIIDFLGHAHPDPSLRRSFLGVTFPTAAGLGAGIDPTALGLPALARFGVGFLEVGPVTCEPLIATAHVHRRPREEALWSPDPPPGPGLEVVQRRLARAGPLTAPVLLRLGYTPGASPEQATAECRAVVERLGPHASLFTLATLDLVVQKVWVHDQWLGHVRVVLEVIQKAAPSRELLVCVPADLDASEVESLLIPAVALGVKGIKVDGQVRAAPSGRLLGPPARESARRLVQQLRQRGDALVLIASAGIHEPEHALQLLAAGADLVAVDSGLVYAGPGLPKRINEALCFTTPGRVDATGEAPPAAAPQQTWFWTMLLGLSMTLGGGLAWLIAATRVVLPYDESFVGMTPDQMTAVNARLLPFMAHDRVSLAGTMVAIGALYLGLSLGGIRRGLHWARLTVLSSAFAGFGSFFLFLGFGYFDPFHAFVTAILFQFLLLALHSGPSPRVETVPPNLREDWRWRWSLWGQLLFVLQGSVLMVAGLVICTIGITTVFVPEDLEFMDTTAAALAGANPRLVPLVAHDRASFGGMLISCGLAVLLSAQWGFRQGYRWLWWTLLAAGAAGYTAAIGVHLAVGYTNLWHLAPAFAGATAFLGGLALAYPYLCRLPPSRMSP
jgi:dihydroorotate dehydrogenase